MDLVEKTETDSPILAERRLSKIYFSSAILYSCVFLAAGIDLYLRNKTLLEENYLFYEKNSLDLMASLGIGIYFSYLLGASISGKRK